ncbi:MAG: hypothetical protein RL318_1695 [Fibrobacterota bacterium]|jgi:uncharacterized protein (TIGR02147 family)
MRPVFDYLDYRDLLKDAYEERKLALPLFSYRMMAEHLGLDSSYLFRILQKDLHLPGRCQPRAIEYLGLTGRAAEYFLMLLAYARERGSQAKQSILEKAMTLRDVERRKLEEKELAFFRDWWVVAVRCLIEITDGRAHVRDLASRLQPPVAESDVQSALDLLHELGLVKKLASGRLALTEAHLTAGGEEKTQAVRHFQRQILSLAAESLERFPKEARDVSTLTLTIDEAAFKDIREMLRESRRQIQKRVEEAVNPDRVMQLSMAFFPLASAKEKS